MKLLRRTKDKMTKNKNSKNTPHLKITEIVLVRCNIINSDYQHDSRVLYTFVPDKSFGQLLDISSKNFIFLKTFNSEFSYIEVRFTNPKSNPLGKELKTNFSLVINYLSTYKK